MRRLRNISYSLAGLLVIIVVAIILINSIMGKTNKTLSYLSVNNIALRSEMEKTNLPLKVLRNIAGQTIDSEQKRQNLAAAFDGNLEKAFEASLVIGVLAKDIENSFRSLQHIYFMDAEFEEMIERVKEVQYHNGDLKKVIAKIESQGNLNNSNLVDEAMVYQTILVQKFGDYQSAYIEQSLNLKSNQIIILDILVGLLVLTIIALLFLLHRIVNKDLRILTKTYDQIKNRSFDDKNIWSVSPFFEEEKEMYAIVGEYFADERLIKEFSNLVNNEYVMDEIIDHLLQKTQELMGVNRVGILFYDSTREILLAEYGVATYDELLLGAGYHIDVNKSSLKQVIDEKEGYINNNLLNSFKRNPYSKSLDLITSEGLRSNMAIPLIMNNEVFGIVFFSSLKENHFTKRHFNLAKQLIYEITGALNRSYLMKVFMNRITMSFANLVDKKDIETGDHLSRMVKYSVAIAESLKDMNLSTHEVDQKMIYDIERNAAVHDIGKVGTPDYILKKPGKLTTEEFEAMKEHTTIGADIFKNLNEELSSFSSHFFEAAENIARYHHEKWNGTGYPEQLKGLEIPLIARIVAMGDVFDALTSKRVYKDAMSFEETVALIQDSSGQHFDPVVVEAFISGIDKIREIYDTTR